MKYFIYLVPLLVFAFPGSNDRSEQIDTLTSLNQSEVTIDDALIVNETLNVTGTTTLNTSLNGFLKAASGVVSTQALIDLTSEVTGVLPYANGGTNTNTSFTDNSIIFSNGGSFSQDNANLNWDDSSDILTVNDLTFESDLVKLNGGNELFIEAGTGGVPAILSLSSANAAAADNSSFRVYGRGKQSSIVNTEFLSLRWDTSRSNYVIDTQANGTGTIRALELRSNSNNDQLLLNTDGSLSMSGDLTLNSTGALALPVGTQAQRPGTPATGMIRFDSDDDKFEGYNGTSWSEIAGAGGDGTGDINYIANSNFETNANNWTGDTNLSIAQDTTSKLIETGSLQITKGTVDASGQCVVSDAFTIDTGTLARKFWGRFYYNFDDSDYADDDAYIRVRKDPSGTPTTVLLDFGKDIKAGSDLHYFGFQTDATETEYDVSICWSATTTTEVIAYVDRFLVGPLKIARGAVVTDWEDFTPTGSWTTNVTYSGRYRRVGDSIEVEYFIETSGAPNTGALGVNLPGGLSVDTNKIVYSSEFGLAIVGLGTARDSGVQSIPARAFVRSTTSEDINIAYLHDQGSGSDLVDTSFVEFDSPFVFGSGDSVYISAKVPIQGWGSTAQVSQDLGGRNIIVEASGNSNDAITANTTNIPFSGTEHHDTTSSFDGTSFTAPESNWYRVSGSVNHDTPSPHAILAYVDNAVASPSVFLGVQQGATDTELAGDIYLEKDQVLTLRSTTTFNLVNTSSHRIYITKSNSGNQTLFETETVAARYTTNAGLSVPNSIDTTVVFEDIDGDTHGAYNTTTGIYTVPKSGWYDVKSCIQYANATFSSGSTLELILHIDGVEKVNRALEINNTNTTRPSLDIDVNIYIEKGAEVEILTRQNEGSSRSLLTISSRNNFSIHRIK